MYTVPLTLQAMWSGVLLVESTVRHSFMPMGLDSSAWSKMREVWEEGGIYMYMYVQVSIELEPEDVSL